MTGLSLAGGLMITLIGIPVLLGTLLLGRLLARLERERAPLVLGERFPTRDRPIEGTLGEKARAVVTDPDGWLGLLWGVLLLPIGIAGFTVAVTAWSTTLALVSSPLWYWALPEDDDTIALLESTALGWSALRVLIGLALLPVAYGLCRALALGSAHLARALFARRPAHGSVEGPANLPGPWPSVT